MKSVLAVITLGILAVVGVMVWVRIAPIDPERWHVDPFAAAPPGDNGWLVRPSGGDAIPPTFQMRPEELLAEIDDVARDATRTRAIAGSVEEGRVTYVSRSLFWGFPDFTTVATVGEDDGSRPVLLGRARYGQSDLGVNRARIERWLAAIK